MSFAYFAHKSVLFAFLRSGNTISHLRNLKRYMSMENFLRLPVRKLDWFDISMWSTWCIAYVNEVHENINYVDVPFPLIKKERHSILNVAILSYLGWLNKPGPWWIGLLFLSVFSNRFHIKITYAICIAYKSHIEWLWYSIIRPKIGRTICQFWGTQLIIK